VNGGRHHLDQRGEPLRCPACSSRLVELERSDVLIDACPECRGVWLDRGELDKILDRERRAAAGVRDDDEDFFREMSGERSRERHEEPRRHEGKRHYDEDYEKYKKRKKRKKSMLEELLDF
jgi:Zn-finger nucleic acid-binding protein